MTQISANQPMVSIEKAEKKSSRMMDRALSVAGITFAAAAAFFPWYVFFNEDKFGIHVAAIDHTRDLAPRSAQNAFSVSPMAMTNKNEAEARNQSTDSLITATVPKANGKEKGPQDQVEQPFPGKVGFHLLHVSNGRALIEDASGMYMVRIGSALPDNSKLATMEQRNGKWVIVTSTGAVVEPD